MFGQKCQGKASYGKVLENNEYIGIHVMVIYQRARHAMVRHVRSMLVMFRHVTVKGM
jgi:hypothetical protein